MAPPASGLLRGERKWIANPRGISSIGAQLVFRGAHQECSHNPKEISALRPELVFGQIPRKLLQRRRQAQWLRRLFARAALLDAIPGSVLRVAGAPPCLCLLPPCLLAFSSTTGALSGSYSGVGAEPMTADRAGSLPERGHRASSSARLRLACWLRGISDLPISQRNTPFVHRPWVISGKHRWVTSRERRRPFQI